MKPGDKNFIELLVQKAGDWILSQRNRYRPGARELRAPEKEGFEGHFSPRVLSLARITEAPLIENPDFYAELYRAGFRQVMNLDLRRAVGITYLDTILISRLHFKESTPWPPLLFHELVHVAQYEVLGLRRFIEQYVKGWTGNDFNYYLIPLEEQAYQLQARYEKNPGLVFEVEAQLRKMLPAPPLS